MKSKKSPKSRSSRVRKHHSHEIYEAEILNGLKPCVREEIYELLGKDVHIFETSREDQLTFTTTKPYLLKSLKTPVAVFLLIPFNIASPTKLLEVESFSKIIQAISAIRSRESFHSFRLSAAGSDSPFFQHFARELEKKANLKHDPEDGEMVLRFRRTLLSSFGWDVLIRITPRPLSARSWRLVNEPGALNGTIAAAMVRMSAPTENDTVLNAMCGSGTLLIERHACGKYNKLVGIDHSSEMLEAAKRNLEQMAVSTDLIQHDLMNGFHQFGPFGVILCDLPYGHKISKGQNLRALYEMFFQKSWEALVSGGRLVVMSQELKLLDTTLQQQAKRWKVLQRIRVKQADLLPVIISCKKISS